MKKLISLAGICIFMLTGCGVGATKTMSCTYRNTGNSLTTKMTYSIDYQGTEVKKLRVTYDYHQNDMNNDIANNGTNANGGTNGTTTNGGTNDITNNGATTNEKNTDGVGTGTDGTTNDDFPDNDYRVTYVIDYDSISDADLATLNLSRDINTLRRNYTNQGFTCAE